MNILRDLSLILLAIEASFFILIPLALSGGLVYVLWRLLKRDKLPRWLRAVRASVIRVRSYVERATRTVVRPIVRVNSILAMMRTWLGALTKRGGS